jgi:hypothetical protein
MSTTFAIKVEDNEIEVARRRGIGNGKVAIIWLNELVKILPNETPVIPIDNSPQGVETLGDLRYLHEHHRFEK